VISNNDFYVYQYSDNGTPFYIGKGRRNRITEHWNGAKKGVYSKTNRLMAGKLKSLIHLNSQPEIIKLFENLTSDQALKIEEGLILSIGRKITGTGPLLNILARGGKPCRGTSHKLALEHRLAISKGLKRAYDDGRRNKVFPKTSVEGEITRRQAISKALTGYKRPPMTEEHREKIRKALSGKPKSEEHIINVANALRGKSPSVVRRTTYMITANFFDEIVIERNSVNEFANERDLNASSLYRTLKRGTPIEFGKSRGWQLISLSDKHVAKLDNHMNKMFLKKI
jgi:hypothetical protein